MAAELPEPCDQPYCWCRQDLAEPPARVMRWTPDLEPVVFEPEAA